VADARRAPWVPFGRKRTSRPTLEPQMKRILSLSVAAAVVCTAGILPSMLPPPLPDPRGAFAATAALGDGARVQQAYSQWAAARDAGPGRDIWTLPLGWSKALSTRHTRASATVRLDFADGTVHVEADGLPHGVGDVWLVDNQPAPDDSVRPEPHDKLLHAGRLRHRGGRAHLVARLGPGAFRDFDVDLVAIAENGAGPGRGGLLFGSPTLFERQHRRAGRTRAGLPATADPLFPVDAGLPGFWRRAVTAAFHPVAEADHAEDPLVAAGRRLFFEETFRGNGRTCGTCHPAGNNTTIDPAFIATLPPRDPLFVAEFVPALAANFENPRLMRAAGLILENLDGFDRPGVMRSVPYTLALPTSINVEDPAPGSPRQRTGWGGDGAPGSGTLREFATGAVTQHFPLTLGRVPGRDFRLPTDAELDAMEAFQLSLGRQADLNLAALRFRNPQVALGGRIFDNTTDTAVAQGKCSGCHANAGALTAGTASNGNFDTGVSNAPSPASQIDPVGTAKDGGLGRQPLPGGGFGDGTFNAPAVVEAADTAPFFHTNAARTVEEAVTFYTTDAFRQSPSGQFSGGISLSATDIAAVGAFLRVINSLENIRSSQVEDLRAIDANNIHRARPHLLQSIRDTADAVRVLNERGLHNGAVTSLNQALQSLASAFVEPNKHRREAHVAAARAKKTLAVADMLL
jgi:mono/diheme cytochrome c family protein